MSHRRRQRYGNPDRNQPGILDFARKRLHVEPVVTTGVGGGFPDVLIPFAGLTVLVEVKRKGKQKKLDPDQDTFHRNWQGGPILVVDDAMDLYRQLVDLDCATPPIRGLPADFTRKVVDTVKATLAAEDTAGTGV